MKKSEKTDWNERMGERKIVTCDNLSYAFLNCHVYVSHLFVNDEIVLQSLYLSKIN